MTPWWFHSTKGMRRRALQKQQIAHVEIRGLEHLSRALDRKAGVLIAPNHSFHWDSYCLMQVADRLAMPFYIMSAWQVFAMSSRFEAYSMQRCGCFSVDREGTDLAALKTAVDVIQNRREPLVVFPEGDIYHTNDRLTPFRDGAAAMALMASRKSERPIEILPVAIKRWYQKSPQASIERSLNEIESRLFWKPKQTEPITKRILRIAQGLLCLKEIETFGKVIEGELKSRLQGLIEALLSSCEERYQCRAKDSLVPERVKEIRRAIIRNREEQVQDGARVLKQSEWDDDMNKMFVAIQLYSYPGDYMLENPSWERVAETVDKLEEDLLRLDYPTVRGWKDVVVSIGPAISLPVGAEAKSKKMNASEITDRIELAIQSQLDELNAQRPSGGRIG
jgi:hypothetical protein